ncbi:L,D-transpeptidase family protein [Aquibacillus koreensis]|uniref:L,D-transpeptidase family protein n=1 Tax=Aquibacillus koreensis TaxID=279446 RepID=A0A9X3WQC2_9BACI|nr:L,D-transpeptidase family protein [Aquibacillus koreensis]MCT2535263.1 L,D-transpeptidase family protein [Aquibacillus koreensis]MDC3422778.1 L,D-transpeptidase family protein [Aquibacillus koreensis]
MIHTVKVGETLSSIAADYRKPLETIIQANPQMNPDVIFIGQQIVIPGFPLIGDIAYSIVVDLTDRKLTLLKNAQIQKVYPVGVGRMLHETPTGNYIIINKAPNPGGPYGTMWMSISKKHYGIHGTNDPSSIGNYVSRGCVRMYNKDVEELSSIIPIGTPVKIVT